VGIQVICVMRYVYAQRACNMNEAGVSVCLMFPHFILKTAGLILKKFVMSIRNCDQY